MVDRFKVALAQLEPRLRDKEANLIKADKVISQAAAQGADVVLFPELYLTGYSLGERAADSAETCDGASVRRVAELARHSQIAVVMGYAELSEDGKHAYDAAFAITARGQVAGSYRKVHLFQQENGWFLPGEGLNVIDFGLGPTGLLICYDLEFPEAARELALRGARWIAVCTGNILPNQHLQEVYVQARAAENRCWVALANRTGSEGDLTFFGGSAVATPSGELADQAGDKETLFFAEIDLTRSHQARLNADYLVDRRPQIYTHLVKS